MPQNDLLTELRWRGLVYQHTEGFPEALNQSNGAPITGYCGFDPTAPSLHIGNLVQIMGLVHLQRCGHRPLALVGGGTGMIGDPSGKSAERSLQTTDQVANHVAGIREQLGRFLDFGGPKGAVMQDNGEWLLKIGAVEFMRDVGKHFTVNYMLAKDSVKSRIDGGISYTEFSYMLLQAYDFLQLHRLHGVTLQTGGSDQWGNITAGIELIRRSVGGEAHGLTLPLVTSASGAKFGKTESGTVWLDAKLTSPYKFLQFWINVDDRDVVKYLKFFTLLSEDEIGGLERVAMEQPERREAQIALARDVTTRVHGVEATRIAFEASGVLFAKTDPTTLSADVFEALAEEVPSATIRVGDVATVADLFVQAALVKSKGEARRLADQGGTYVNGERTPGAAVVGELARLAGSHLLLRKGARDYAVVKLVD